MRKTSRRTDRAENSTLTPEDRRRRVFQRAIKLLAAKPRSVAELRERLLEAKGASKATVEEVVMRLSEYGYLDDERYAFGYASLRIKQKPIGRRRLERDLKLRKVEAKTAGDALDIVFKETSENELIDRAIEKRIRLRGRPQTREDTKKLFDYLLRQGFGFELVSEKVRAAAAFETDEEPF